MWRCEQRLKFMISSSLALLLKGWELCLFLISLEFYLLSSEAWLLFPALSGFSWLEKEIIWDQIQKGPLPYKEKRTEKLNYYSIISLPMTGSSSNRITDSKKTLSWEGPTRINLPKYCPDVLQGLQEDPQAAAVLGSRTLHFTESQKHFLKH